MKKTNLIIAIILVVVVAFGAYIYLGKPKPGKAPTVGADSPLSFIPEDTIVFFGGVTPFKYGESLKPYDSLLKSQMTVAEALKDSATDPAAKLFAEFMADAAQAPDFDKVLSDYGIGQTAFSSFYFVGRIPVLRLSLENSDAFSAKLTSLEQQGGISPRQKSHGGIDYRFYALSSKNDAGLAIAQHNSWLIITLDLVKEEYNTFLATALGGEKPDKTLADSAKITSILNDDTLGLDTSAFGFIDHKNIIAGIFDSNSRLSQTLGIIGENDPQFQRGLDDMRASGCEKDIAAIAENWPRTVFGYDKIDMTANPKVVNSIMRVEVKDTELLNGLQKVRGFIPSRVTNVGAQSVADLGLGLTVDNLMPLITQITGSIQQKQYSCPPLQEMQRNMAGPGLMGLGMATGMAAGVRGLSLSILELTLKTPQNMMPQVDKLDAVLALTADDPSKLIAAASAMVPGLQGMQIPTDGTAIDFPMPMPMINAPVKLAVKGKHIVAFTGERATQAANDLTAVQPEVNGFFAFRLDYAQYADKLMQLTGNMGAMMGDATEQEALEALSALEMKLVTELDFTDKGIELTQKSTLK